MREAQLLAQAFHDDPFIRWAEPDATRRPRTAARVFAGMIAFADEVGGHIYEPDVGSVHWRPSRHAELDTASVARTGTWTVALVAPPAVWWRLLRHESAAMAYARRFLDDDAIYLCQLGVSPALAGQGHGTRLLQSALERMAPQGKRCVLRTEQPKNLPFYERNGFKRLDEVVIAESGLRTWYFCRPLRS
jgi:ribosomal protein S18 acetylase RimI-like enzyme